MQRDQATSVPKYIYSKTNGLLLPVIASAEIFFQPDVEADEQITAAHFLDLQFCLACASVLPSDGHRSPSEAAHNRFQWQLHRQVKVWRDERAAAFNHFAAISLEGVGCVLEGNAEQNFNEPIGQPVERVFDERIIHRPAALDEPAAEHAV